MLGWAVADSMVECGCRKVFGKSIVDSISRCGERRMQEIGVKINCKNDRFFFQNGSELSSELQKHQLIIV